MTYSECAKQYLGTVENSRAHKAIIDYYNHEILPLPRGYRVKYSDSWCAVFVSVIMDKCNAINAPYECSCVKMLTLARQKNLTVKTPDINHIIFYDWKNNGTVDHVGIISGITETSYFVIEGNYLDSVRTRRINRDSKEIEAVIHVPRQIRDSKVIDDSDRITGLALDVIRGKFGNGSQRKELLGELYDSVQKRVNEIMKNGH